MQTGRIVRRAGLAALIGLAIAAAAAAETVRLTAPKPVAPGVAAFPRIAASPQDKAAQRINAALTRADARVRKAAKTCADEAGPGKGSWARKVTVTMRGAGYLSLLADDEWYCGGPYPSAERIALAYDLAAAKPLDWAQLLPKAMVETTATEQAGDATTIGTVSSKALSALYAKAATAQKDFPAECKDVLADVPLNLILWPDARANGIGVKAFGLPHVAAACAVAVLVPVADWRKAGVDARFLDAIEAAHREKLYGTGR